jgi:hypothetical protein
MNCSGSWGRADGCGSPSTGRNGITTSRCGWPRAIPVQVAAFRKTPIFRSQNGWEHTFLRLRVHTLREVGQTAVLLGDRGFHRVSGLQLLLELKQSFVVRLVADLKVYAGTHEGRLLRHWPSTPGRRSTWDGSSSGRTRPSGSGSSGSGPQGRKNPGGWRPICPTPWQTWWPCMTGAWVWRSNSGIPRAAASA